MAVARMVKAHIVIHDEYGDAVIQRIYDLGVIQAVEVTDQAEPSRLSPIAAESVQNIAALDAQLREILRAQELLAQYDNSGREFIENFITLKERLPRQELARVRDTFDFSAAAHRLHDLTENIKHLEEEEGWVQDDIHELTILSPLPFPLNELHEMTWAKPMIGRLRKEQLAPLRLALRECEDRIYWEEVGVEGQLVYLFFMYFHPRYEHVCDIPAILDEHGFDSLDLSSFSGRIPDELVRLRQRLQELHAEIAQMKAELKEFAAQKQSFKIIEEYVANEIERHKDMQRFAETQTIYLVEGWMKATDKHALEHGLNAYADSVEIFYETPDSNDPTVPVILENPPRLQPFEIITRMFGMPKYYEPDPTPYLAPFFFLFFGLCLTDAAYGVVLVLLMGWFMRKYVVDAGTRQLAKLLYYGGISTIICGALTGGWFGNILDYLPKPLAFVTSVKDSVIVFDPMKQPLIFLGMALILGYIQLCYGIALKMRHRLRNGEIHDAWLDQGIWLLFINSLFFTVILSALGAGNSLFGQSMIVMCQGFALLSGAVRVWMNDRGNPHTVKRILVGLYSLYDIVGIFSDVLSYSRLLALGLATGVIAMIIDMFVLMTGKIPGIGFIVGIVMFCTGHAFNIIINTLGAFIHSGRLQFVEFFSKFFESGGKRYKAFRFHSKYFEFTE